MAAAVQDAAPVIPAYSTDPLGQTAVQAQLAEGRLALHYASACVFADSPAKASAARTRHLIVQAMLPASLAQPQDTA